MTFPGASTTDLSFFAFSDCGVFSWVFGRCFLLVACCLYILLELSAPGHLVRVLDQGFFSHGFNRLEDGLNWVEVCCGHILRDACYFCTYYFGLRPQLEKNVKYDKTVKVKKKAADLGATVSGIVAVTTQLDCVNTQLSEIRKENQEIPIKIYDRSAMVAPESATQEDIQPLQSALRHVSHHMTSTTPPVRPAAPTAHPTAPTAPHHNAYLREVSPAPPPNQ